LAKHVRRVIARQRCRNAAARAAAARIVVAATRHASTASARTRAAAAAAAAAAATRDRRQREGLRCASGTARRPGAVVIYAAAVFASCVAANGAGWPCKHVAGESCMAAPDHLERVRCGKRLAQAKIWQLGQLPQGNAEEQQRREHPISSLADLRGAGARDQIEESR